MGVDLAKLFTANGHKVSVTSRSKRESQAHVHYLQGNALDMRFLTSILSSPWDVIVDFMIYNSDEFAQRVDLLLSSTSHYVFLSSARVYAESNSPIIETSNRLLEHSTDESYLSTDEYALTKARQENILLNTKRSNWTVIRPYITYNNYRLQLGPLEKEQWLHRAMRGHAVILPESIANKSTTLTHGRDVAKTIFSLSTQAKARGETYHVTGGESLTWLEVADIYMNALENSLGIKPRVCLVSDEEFALIHYGKYQLIYDRQFNRTFSLEKISQFVDLNSFLPIKEGLTLSLSEFIKNPQFHYISWENEALQDKLSKQCASLRSIIGWRARLRYLRRRFLA